MECMFAYDHLTTIKGRKEVRKRDLLVLLSARCFASHAPVSQIKLMKHVFHLDSVSSHLPYCTSSARKKVPTSVLL